jgi:uncharacterized protein YycO
MSNLVLAFMDSDKFAARAIRTLTWSDYSHVGILTKGDQIVDSRFLADGVTEYPFDDARLEHPRVLCREYNIPAVSVIEAARSQIGKPYDWTAVCGVALHRDWTEPNKWFCSELVAWAAACAGIPMLIKEYGRVTPQDLLQIPFIRQW